MHTENLNINSFLTFKLGTSIYAVNVIKVVNILELSHITKIPAVTEFILGVINIRGMVLPVIDTRVRFHLPQTEFTVNTCILAIEVEYEKTPIIVGALVDAVLSVIEIDPNKIVLNISTNNIYRLNFVTGLFVTEDNVEIKIIDIDLLFAGSDIVLFSEMAINSVINT